MYRGAVNFVPSATRDDGSCKLSSVPSLNAPPTSPPLPHVALALPQGPPASPASDTPSFSSPAAPRAALQPQSTPVAWKSILPYIAGGAFGFLALVGTILIIRLRRQRRSQQTCTVPPTPSIGAFTYDEDPTFSRYAVPQHATSPGSPDQDLHDLWPELASTSSPPVRGDWPDLDHNPPSSLLRPDVNAMTPRSGARASQLHYLDQLGLGASSACSQCSHLPVDAQGALVESGSTRCSMPDAGSLPASEAAVIVTAQASLYHHPSNGDETIDHSNESRKLQNHGPVALALRASRTGQSNDAAESALIRSRSWCKRSPERMVDHRPQRSSFEQTVAPDLPANPLPIILASPTPRANPSTRHTPRRARITREANDREHVRC